MGWKGGARANASLEVHVSTPQLEDKEKRDKKKKEGRIVIRKVV
jgi:hypothetical protein